LFFLFSFSISIHVLNESQAGRTLAIDRGGPETAAILGVEEWIERAKDESEGRIDVIVICLGTNDIQKSFAARETSPGEEGAITEILPRVFRSAPDARVIIATPPPVYDSDNRALAKPPIGFAIDSRWTGAGNRLKRFEKAISVRVGETKAVLLNLSGGFQISPCDAVERDGVHLNLRGQKEVARIVAFAIRPMLQLPAPRPTQ
jgi:lysophospholipase L1-like esterase